MRFKLTKLNKLIICTIGLFSIFSLLATSFNREHFETRAIDPVEGYYAKAAGDATLTNLTFELSVTTSAPQDSTKYKTTASSLKVLRENGTEQIVAESVDVFTKTSATKYTIASSVFSGIGSLNVGDTIILEGNFVRDDFVIHIKQSKIHVFSENLLVTLPHRAPNVTSYFDGVKPSKEIPNLSGHDWTFLIYPYYPNELPWDLIPMTGAVENQGYFPTSKNSIFIDGVASARCDKDAIRRRDDWGNEIFINLDGQINKKNPDVGTLVVLDGTFCYKSFTNGAFAKNPTISLEPGELLGIEINLLALLKVGTGIDDYKQIDLKSYLSEKFETLYNADLYNLDDYEEILTIHNTFKSGMQNFNTAKEIYSMYNSLVAQMEAKTLSKDGFNTFKNHYKNEIRNYVDLTKYRDLDVKTIQTYIKQCDEAIDLSTNPKEVLSAVENTKNLIDNVRTRLQKMESAILNHTDGYEEFLAPYDNVTLNDLSLGNSLTFHGRVAERGGDINTNKQEKNQFNLFTPSPNNRAGNVSFNFKYKANALPTAESNVVIVLRGIQYFGYKFGIGTGTQGFTFKCTFGSTDTEFSGTSDVFISSTEEYNVSVSAIDLIEGNRTWIRVVVNNVEKLSKIIDSLSFCANPRVALSNNDNEFSNVDGTAVISNYYPSSVSNLNPFYCGRFEYELGHKDNNQTMHMTLESNDLKFASTGMDSYALDSNNVKLIRDDEEFVLGRTDIPILGKYSDTTYQLYLSDLFNDDVDTLYPGDIVIVSGLFSYFDSESYGKVLFEIGTSKFIFKGKNKGWVADLSIEDAKNDATKTFDFYKSSTFQAKYDDDGKLSINNLVEAGAILVNQAETVDEVIHILNRVTLSVKAVKTAFEKYQDQAISTIAAYKVEEKDLYRQEEQGSIDSIKLEATNNIKLASSKEEIDKICSEAIARLNSILTDEEMSISELNEAIYQQINEIKNRYASLIKDSMTSEEIEKLNKDTLDAIEKVKAAKTIEEANELATTYLNAHPIEETKKDNTTTIIAISVSCGGALLIGGGLLTFFLIRKRKKAKQKE